MEAVWLCTESRCREAYSTPLPAVCQPVELDRYRQGFAGNERKGMEPAS